MADQYSDSFWEYLGELPKATSLGRYMAWLCDIFENKDPLFINDYEPIARREQAIAKGAVPPFLSVIMRVQAGELEELSEKLLCLAAQRDQDFEVVLVGHNTDKAQNEEIREAISIQPEFLRKKTRFYPLDHGKRATALNSGIAHSLGRYVACFNDALVLEDWVDKFHEAASINSGALIHAGVHSKAQTTSMPDGVKEGTRIMGDAEELQIEPFNMFRQLRNDECPIVGFAFPSYLFHKLGIIFDETLDAEHEWDYITRCAFIAGVEDVPYITALQCRQESANGGTSEKLLQERNANYIRILEKFRKIPFIIPAGVEKAIPFKKMMELENYEWPHQEPRIQVASLYLDFGYGLSQDEVSTNSFLSDGKYFEAAFDLYTKPNGDFARGIRFDPGEEGFFVIKNVTLILDYVDGSREMRSLSQSVTNGLMGSGKILFVKDDPFIWWREIKKPVKKARVIGEITTDITDRMIVDFMLSEQRRGLARKLHSALNRIKGK